MERKLYFYLLIILILSGTRLYAQSGTTQPVFSLTGEYTKLIPRSPEAEGLGKYGVVPVSLYSGTPNVSIPIYDIHWGSLTLPINLTYNNNGLKPSEVASRVGHGWCLNAGGVITRIVKGMVDESIYSRRFDSYPNIYDFNYDYNVLDSIVKGNTDGEPDVYIFNFNGHTGKFIYVNGKAYFTSQEDLRISKINEDFQIITEDGTLYDFAAKESTSSPHQMSDDDPVIPQHNTAWFLTKITSKDTKDVINFSYSQNHTFQHTFLLTETYTEKFNDNFPAPEASYFYNPITPAPTLTQTLESISFGANTISFYEDTERRLDIIGTDMYALKSIQINASICKKFNFIYGYFGEGKKLKLSEIQQADGENKLLNKYLFNYNDENLGFPAPDTKGIDIWGYYNGIDNHSLLSNLDCNYYNAGDRSSDYSSAQKGVLSKITYPTGGTTTFLYEPNYYGAGKPYYNYKWADLRTSYVNGNGDPQTSSTSFYINEEQEVNIFFQRNFISFPSTGVKTVYPIIQIMNGNTLVYSKIINYTLCEDSQMITLPVGTYTLILACSAPETSTYVSLTYKELTQDMSPGNLGPGIRIKSIISDDKKSSTHLIKNYDYHSSGGFFPHSEWNSLQTSWQLIDMNCNYVTGHDVTYRSNNGSSIGSMLDSKFYYSKVTETTSSGLTTGKTVTDFYPLDNGRGSLLEVVPIQECQWKSTGVNNYLKVKNTRYSYSVYLSRIFIEPKVLIARYGKQLTFCGLMGLLPDQSPDELDTEERTKVYSIAPHPTTYNYYRLKSEISVLYSENQSDSIVNKKEYLFSNSRFSMPQSIIEFNSMGEKLTTRSLYPKDYSILPSSVLTPDQIETNYNNTLTSISNNFSVGRAHAIDVCLPYQGSYWTDQQFIARVNANKSYKADYFKAYKRATTVRDSCLGNYYSQINSLIISSPVQNSKAILTMQRDHIMNPPVEQHSYKQSGNNTSLIAAIKSFYATYGTNDTNTNSNLYIPLVESIWSTELSSPIDSAIFNSNSIEHYKYKLKFDYDGYLKMIGQTKVNDATRSYIWGYNNQYPIAEAINATNGDIAYTSFEGDESGNWNIWQTYRNSTYSLTGKKSYDISNGLSFQIIGSGKYIISYWIKNGSCSLNAGLATTTTIGRTVDGWTYYEHEINPIDAYEGVLTLTGSGLIDEVRLYPKGAQMTSYTYTPFVGMTTQNDAKNNITFYNYDSFGRLANVLDGNKNIIKEHTYNYGTNPANNIFYNTEKSQSFQKTGCGTGYHGSWVIDTIPEGRYSSTVSQPDADLLALNDLAANGPGYANTNGYCVSDATQSVTIGLDASTTLADIGLCTITIRDAGNNTILLNRTSDIGIMFLKHTSISASSNGYYTVTIVPDASKSVTGTVNNVSKDLFSTQTWTQVSGDIAIVLSAALYY